MNREVQDLGIFQKHILYPISMMHVPVHYQHLFHSKLLLNNTAQLYFVQTLETAKAICKLVGFTSHNLSKIEPLKILNKPKI